VRAASAFLALALLAAAALAQPALKVATDASFYEPGSAVTISVSGPPNAPVGIEVRGPLGELVALAQLTLDARGAGTFTLQLDPQCREGVYTVYAATPGAAASVTFEVVARPTPLILLVTPGTAAVGREARILGFVYPGLPLAVAVYVRRAGGPWVKLGAFQANSSGWFAAAYTPTDEGLYEVRAEFEGAREYGPSSALANFTASRSPPQWRVEAPPRARLGESFVVNCSGCEAVVARTAAGERVYRCGSRVALDVPGPWALYPASRGMLGAPAITIVRARLSVRLEGPSEVGAGEPFTLYAHLYPPVPALRVAFVANGSALAEALSRANGTALARVALPRLGEYRVVAAPHATSIFEVGESRPLIVRVVGERVYVRVIVTDAAGRRLYDSVVEVAGSRYEAPMGVAEFAVRAGTYALSVLWRGLRVFSGAVRLEGGNVTVRAELYDLNVTVLDFLGRPAEGVLVELYNGTRRLAAGVTGEGGRLVVVRVPPGAYTVRAEGTSVDVIVPAQAQVVLKLPPPPWLAPLAAALVLAMALAAARRYIRVSVKKLGSRPS